MSVLAVANRFMGAAVAALNVDPVHPKDRALARMFGMGTQTKAGVTVDHESVMTLPAVMRATRIISNGVAKIPHYVFKEDGSGGRTWDRNHPAWYCLTVKPNEEMNWHTLKQTMTAWAMLWGNAVAYIDRPRWPFAGQVDIIPLLPDRTYPVRVTRQFADRYSVEETLVGKKYYRTLVDGAERYYAADSCLHIKGLGPNPHWGYDIVEMLKEAFGGATAAQDFGNRYWGSGANPAGFIEMPAGLDEEAEERFAESIRRGSEGMGRAHKFMLLEEGAKFHQWTVDPKAAQFLEGKQFDIRQIAMAIGIKVHKLIDSANSSFNSLEQANQEHKDDDLLPWIYTWQHELTTKFLTEEQQASGTHSIGIDDEMLEWSPFGERARGVVELYNNGLIEKDEGRRRVNFGPSKSPFASRFRKPINIGFEDEVATVAVDPMAGEEQDREESQRLAAMLAAMKADHLCRIAKRLSKLAAAKSAKKDGGKDFLAWVDSLASESAPIESLQAEIDTLYASLRESMSGVAETAKPNELETAVAVAVAEWLVSYEGVK
jgi:HK97 family phage portal protein